MRKNYVVLILLCLPMIIFSKGTYACSIPPQSDGHLSPPMVILAAASPDMSESGTTTQEGITIPEDNVTTDSSVIDNTTPNTDDSKTTPPSIITKPKPVKSTPPSKVPPDINKTTPKQPVKQKKTPIPPTKNTKPKPIKKPNKKIQTSKGSPETFINNLKLSSSTHYLIWIDTSTQRTHIFNNDTSRWKLNKTFICATGKDSTPTVKGIYKTGSRAAFVYDKKYNCYLKYVTQIYKGYLMHSVILNKEGRIIDGTLGRKKSHGCVRLSLNDSKWIYDNIPLKTTIYIT